MPINFNRRDEIDRLTDLFGNPTGWGSGVINLLTGLLGSANPFNSAALADAGDAAGNVPVLDAGGIQETHLNPASASDAGVVRTAEAGTTDALSGGFPLVMAASLAASMLPTSTGVARGTEWFELVESWFGGRGDLDGGDSREIETGTGRGILILSGARTGRGLFGQPVRFGNRARLSGSRSSSDHRSGGFSVEASGFGGGISPALLSSTELGDDFRWGFRLPGFGQSGAELVIAFKEESTQSSFILRGGQNSSTSAARRDGAIVMFIRMPN